MAEQQSAPAAIHERQTNSESDAPMPAGFDERTIYNHLEAADENTTSQPELSVGQPTIATTSANAEQMTIVGFDNHEDRIHSALYELGLHEGDTVLFETVSDTTNELAASAETVGDFTEQSYAIPDEAYQAADPEDFLEAMAVVLANRPDGETTDAAHIVSEIASDTTETPATLFTAVQAAELSRHLPPEAQQLNLAVIEQLEQSSAEQADDVSQALTDIIQAIRELETYVAIDALAAEQTSQQPEDEQLDTAAIATELEANLQTRCRELLRLLNLEADESTVRAFARHLALMHSLERPLATTTTPNLSLLEEGTHEAKYFGIHAWHQLVRYMRRHRLQPHILGRYAVAWESTGLRVA